MRKEYIVCDVCDEREHMQQMPSALIGSIHVCHKCINEDPKVAKLFQAILQFDQNAVDGAAVRFPSFNSQGR